MLKWVSTVNYRINHRLRRAAHKATDEASQTLTQSLQRLGVSGPLPHQIRRALWGTAYDYRMGSKTALAWSITVVGLFALTRIVVPAARAALDLKVADGVTGVLIVINGVAWIVCLFTLFAGPNTWLNQGLMFSRAKMLTDAVNSCAAVLAVSPRSRPERLTQVWSDLRWAEKTVVRMYRFRGTVPLWSHRRPSLKTHARLVVARLRVAEARFDSDVEAAAKELGQLLTEVAENYVAGRVGALLPDEELMDLEPARTSVHRFVPSVPDLGRALVMVGVLAVCTIGGVWLGARLGVSPEVAAAPALVVSGIFTQRLATAVPRQPRQPPQH